MEHRDITMRLDADLDQGDIRPAYARPIHGAFLTACWDDDGRLQIGRRRHATYGAARRHCDSIAPNRHGIVLRVVGEDPDWTSN